MEALLTKQAQRLSVLPPELMLGSLVWFECREAPIPFASAQAAAQAVGFAIAGIKPPSDVNVFRRVASSQERRKVPVTTPWGTTVPDRYANYLVRDLPTNKNVLFRQVVREIVDTEDRRLEYGPVVEVRFDKNGSILTWAQLGARDDTAESVAEGIQAAFESWRGCLDASAVRGWLRDHILSHGGTPVRAGVYFVQSSRHPTIESAYDFAAHIPSVTVHALPLVDDERQREMVQQAFLTEVDGQLAQVAQRVKSLPEEIALTTYTDLMMQVRSLSEKGNEFSTLLADKAEGTALAIQAMQRHVLSLQNRLKA